MPAFRDSPAEPHIPFRAAVSRGFTTGNGRGFFPNRPVGVIFFSESPFLPGRIHGPEENDRAAFPESPPGDRFVDVGMGRSQNLPSGDIVHLGPAGRPPWGEMGVLMEELNKPEIGKRIRYLRKEMGLRQWQLAEELESTQPAVHKYENGIIPEVRRLVHLARIGNTTIEWILTGRQWEDGSQRRERFSEDVYQLAERIQQCAPIQTRALKSSMSILENAFRVLEDSAEDGIGQQRPEEIARFLATCNRQTLGALRIALRILAVVTDGMAEEKVRELEDAGFLSEKTQAV